jgi:lysozyme family protein
MAKLKEISDKYQDLFNTMVFDQKKLKKSEDTARTILKDKATYEKISEKLGGKIPWYFIGIIHMMECSCSFSKHLHNGDSLTKRTWQVPAGRPVAEPWNGRGTAYTFIESAMDALTMKGFHVQTSWTLNLCLYRLEKYNGFGYVRRGILTPYLWSGTNHYTKGKFVKDGVYDSNAVSQQIGAAILIRLLTDKTLDIV